MIAVLRRLAYALSIVFGLVVLIPLWAVATLFLRNTSRASAAMTPFHQVVFALLGVKVETNWSDGFDPRRGAILLANHQSWLDIPLLVGWVRPVAFLAKKELFRIPFLSFAMRRIRCIPVDRGNREANKNIVPQMVANLSDGFSYGVFPEGTRSKDGKLGNFRNGIFRIVAGSPISVVPVTIDGAFHVFPKVGWAMRRGTIRVTVHDPISADEVAALDFGQLRNRVESAIASALPQK